MPALALRGLTIYPQMMVHFDVGREASVKAIEEAMSSNSPIFLVAQKDLRVETPDRGQLFDIGTVSTVRQILRLPGKTIRVMVEGEYRARLLDLGAERALPGRPGGAGGAPPRLRGEDQLPPGRGGHPPGL